MGEDQRVVAVETIATLEDAFDNPEAHIPGDRRQALATGIPSACPRSRCGAIKRVALGGSWMRWRAILCTQQTSRNCPSTRDSDCGWLIGALSICSTTIES